MRAGSVRRVAAAAVVAGFLASACHAGGETAGPPPSTGTPSASATAPPASPSPSPSPRPHFSGSIRTVSGAERAAMLASGSWHPGCPVPVADLRVLAMTYWGFDRSAHQGELIVNADVASPVLRAMRAVFRARFPIRRMEPVDAFGASDERSMRADNTSAFNCRGVAGSPGVWSQHAYGRAVDVDPLENPEVRAGVVDPPTGARFTDRSLHTRGMIHAGDAVVRAFAAAGWGWGGLWHSLKDYQHFSLTGT